MNTVAITGNTYPVKEQIKALGGRWNADRKVWLVPADKASAAQALVAGAPKSAYAPARNGGYIRERVYGGGSGSGGWTGCSCGSIEGRPRASDCRSCQHDY